MKKLTQLLLCTVGALVITGCNSIASNSQCSGVAPCAGTGTVITNSEPSAEIVKEVEIVDVVPRAPIIINATGYAAPISNPKWSKSQSRLMSLRGSKIDAYRNLSERVYGLKLNGSSSLRNMMTEHDELRTFVDAYLMGAKVISQRELEDGSFETIVEMALQENFRQCVGSPDSFRSNPACQIKPSYRTVQSNGNTTQSASFYSVE